jgi:hypothetical protein
MSAPDRIWWNGAPLPHSYVSTLTFQGGTEYIRADLSPAAPKVKALVEALRQIERRRGQVHQWCDEYEVSDAMNEMQQIASAALATWGGPGMSDAMHPPQVYLTASEAARRWLATPSLDRVKRHKYISKDLHRAEVEAAVKRALDHYASAVRTLWAKCEQVEDACDEHLNNGEALSEHEQGFWRGQKMLAKSIRRSTEMPASDPEALRRIVEGEP